MITIIFNGWNVGMRGIPFIHLLQEKAHISLKKAKKIKDQIVDNNSVELQIPDVIIASEIVTQSRELGVICDIL